MNEFDPYKSNCTQDMHNDSFYKDNNNEIDDYDKLLAIEEVDESLE